MTRAIDAIQIKLIHIARAQLGLSEDCYRDVLQQRFGVNSSKSLSYDQAHELIEHFRLLGFRIKSKGPTCRAMCAPRPKGIPLPDNVVVLPSPQQLTKINRLAADIKWKYHDGFQRWLKKFFHIDTIKTSLEASMVIEALKNMWRSQNCSCALAKGREQ